MLLIKKLLLLVSLLVVGLLLLAACGAEEPTPAPVEEVVDTLATAGAEANTSVSSTEEQAPMLESEVPRISVEELKERIDNGETLVIGDTRETGVYNANHIVGAISTPEFSVLSQLEGVPLDQAIILYCS